MPSESAVTAPKRRKVLVVEDDDLVRATVANKLTRMGYTVETAEAPDAAIAKLENIPDFDLVFSDVIMPGTKTGADLARDVRCRWPAIRVLLTSGYTASAILGQVDMPAGVDLLSKPYTNADLARAIETAFTGGGP